MFNNVNQVLNIDKPAFESRTTLADGEGNQTKCPC